ncbi:hypothetical protein HY946_01970 [Candidatus Gottesmanbacteria bacterium]|nr:hypothetical protein [Candidatus Gottesmanbacteria bacterium]
MLTKNDLKEALKGIATKDDLKKLKEEVGQEIEEAITQIVKAVGKALEDFATKEDFQRLERRVEIVEADITDIKRDVQDIKADMPTKDDFKNLKKLEDIHRKELANYA